MRCVRCKQKWFVSPQAEHEEPNWEVVAHGAAAGSVMSMVFNTDGTVFVGGSAAGLRKFKGNGSSFTFYPGKVLDSSLPGTTTKEITGLKWEYTDQWVSAPQDRYSLFGSGHYDINDHVTMYALAMMAESETRTNLFGTNAISGWETQVAYNPTIDSPILPTLDYTNAAVVAAAIAAPTFATELVTPSSKLTPLSSSSLYRAIRNRQ